MHLIILLRYYSNEAKYQPTVDFLLQSKWRNI